MKHLFLALLLAASLLSAEAKEKNTRIKTAEVSTTDITAALSVMGVRLSQFDLSELVGKEYNLGFYIDEYKKGKKKKRITNFSIGSNRQTLPEEPDIRKAYIESYQLDVSRKAKEWYIDRISFYIVPQNDSTAFIVMRCPIGQFSKRIGLITLPQNNLPVYDFRTFEIAPITSSSQEIPLLIYNSYFFDAKHNLTRSCYGSITAEMNDEIFTKLPHYYVIGLTLKEVKKE